MSIIRLLLALYFLSSVTNVYSDEYPLIYISPNPNKVNINMHASNIEVISLDKKDVNFSITDILRNNTNLAFSQSGGIASTNQLRMRGGEANHVLALIDGIDVNDPASGAEYDLANYFPTTLAAWMF